MTDSSSFSKQVSPEDGVERLYLSGSTCDTFVVRRFGKLHFKKKLKAQLRGKPMFVEAFRKEFETGYRLDHPALPRYIALEEEDHCPCILEEYVEGETLTAFLASHHGYFRSRNNADKFIGQLLSVMSYLHSHQVLFLDLKPDNVMITSVGHSLRLVDLGGCLTDTYRDTEALSPDFAAPEQLANGTITEQTDIYLIGKLLQYANVSHIYNIIIRNCLKSQPSDRYTNVASMQRAVRHVRLWRKSLAIVLLLAAVVILIGVAAFMRTATVPKAAPSQTVELTDTLAKETARNGVKLQSRTVTKESASSHNTTGNVEKMTVELHHEMNLSYKRHFAMFANESVVAAKDFYSQSEQYTNEIKAVKEYLSKKYPGVNASEIEAHYMDYYNKTVLPLWDKVDIRQWK